MEKIRKLEEQLSQEWLNLKEKHFSYLNSVDTMKTNQSVCAQSLKHCNACIEFMRKKIYESEKTATSGELKEFTALRSELQHKELFLRDVEEMMPKNTGLYLRIVLGALNISFSCKNDRFAYKNDYEQFKIIVSGICTALAFVLYTLIHNRVLDTVFHFLLVWYYCTLTIRERILIANGSRIKGWWNTYHFISTAWAGIMLIWPHSQSYEEFRDQFMLFSLYLNVVHLIQYHYQIGCLYKLRALGTRHPMDITVDGFMSWMFRRLSFILPFLFATYGFELYNAYRLYQIARQPYCHEWQVPILAIISFIMAAGNIITVCMVLKQKIFPPSRTTLHYSLRKKYSIKPHVLDEELELAEIRKQYHIDQPDNTTLLTSDKTH